MLSREDNDLLCRVGPGTPMGDLMRQYWVPAALSSELSEPDGDPLRVRLLGEDLIGFRTTSGEVGLIQNACPHRGAGFFYGRNEAEGIRCVYHGWKFDRSGACVDMPSEPAGSTFKDKVRARAYPCRERGGLIWAYLGPRETPPPMPDLEPVTLSEVGTKLDLARAYVDMGDPDGARNILNEVLSEGSASQKQEAQRLLESLPG